MTDPIADLLPVLADVLEHGAVDAFVAGPIIVHDEAHFPDAWRGDLVSVRSAIRRMLVHVRLPDVRVVLEDAREDVPADRVEGGVHLVDVEGRTATFVVTSVPAPTYMVAAVAFEVARVWLELSGILDGSGGPYRGADEREAALADDETTSIAMFALGLGVLAVNGSGSVVKREAIRGGYVQGRWQLFAVGGLPAPVCEALLAAQLVVRGADDDALAPILAALTDDHRDGARRRLQELRPRAEALSEALRLPPRASWPEPWPADVAPLRDDGDDDELRAEELAFREHLAQPNVDGVVFRVRPRMTMPGAVIGLLAGIVAALIVPAGMGSLALLSLFVAGIVIGRRLRGSHCSDPDCDRPLRPEDRACPGCGGTVAGEIDHRNERLAALERYEAAQPGGGGALPSGDA